MTKPTVLAALTAPAVAAAGFCFGRKLSQVWRRGRSTPRPDVPSLSFSEAVHLSGIDDARRYLTERELEVYVGEAYRNGDEAADEYLRTVSLQRCTETQVAPTESTNAPSDATPATAGDIASATALLKAEIITQEEYNYLVGAPQPKFTDEESARALLDAGIITQAEYDRLFTSA